MLPSLFTQVFNIHSYEEQISYSEWCFLLLAILQVQTLTSDTEISIIPK